MDNLELISLINCISNALTPVSTIVAAIISFLFLRRNTSSQEFEKIKAGRFNDAIEDLLASGKMTYIEYYKTKNFLVIARKADEYYSHKREQFAEPQYDLDWFFRFYETVGSVSDQQMQELWARILAGEVRNPGSHSFHLIEILKRMSKTDAELFNKICSLSIEIDDHIFIPNYKSYLSHYGISFDELLILDEFGLINTNGMISLNVIVPVNGRVICKSIKNEIYANSITDKREIMKIDQFPLTHVGRELRAIQTVSWPDDCLDILITDLTKIKNVALELRSI